MKITLDIKFTPEELLSLRESLKDIIQELVIVPKLERTYTVDEVTEILRLGKTKIYELIAAGELKANKTGKGWTITESSLIQYQKGFCSNGREQDPH